MKFDNKYNFLKYKDNFRLYSHVQSRCVVKRTTHTNAKVTIAIPTFNGGELLCRAVGSVLSQVEFDDYNILIVENAPSSTISLSNFYLPNIDNVEERAKRISIYINDENIGMCPNWNRCVELCESQYMVMLHTDDYLMPEYLKEVMAVVAEKQELGMLQTSRIKDNKFRMENLKSPVERFCLLDLVPLNQLCAPSGMLLRVEYVKQIGGWDNSFTDYFDCYFNALFLTKFPVYVLNKPLTFYRAHNDYPLEVKKNIGIGEYYLHYQILRSYHVPEFWALPQPYTDLYNFCKYNQLDIKEFPIEYANFSNTRILWSRRLEKFMRIFVHRWINKYYND